jgi:exosome complex component RRP41
LYLVTHIIYLKLSSSNDDSFFQYSLLTTIATCVDKGRSISIMTTSLRRADLLALSNLRNDGRKPEEIRRLRVQMGCLGEETTSVAGSALLEMGLTMALASVRGPMECARRSDELSDRAMLEVTVQAAPFGHGTDRRVTNPTTDRRLVEASHWLQKAMEASILLHLHPKSRIQIHVLILSDDGGRLCAAINAATLAVMDAGIPMKDFCVACAAGLSLNDDTTLVDLNRREESSNAGQPAVVLPCAMLPQRGTLVLAQCEARLPSTETLHRVQAAAMEGCRAVFEILQAAVRERATTLLSARKGHAMVENAFAY